MMSAVYQNFQIDRRAKVLAKKFTGKLFYYRFGLDTELNYYKNLFGAQEQYGASHADDLCYIFHCGNAPEPYKRITTFQYSLIKQMTGIYSNFAKYGNPLPNGDPVVWKPVTSDNISFMDITMNGLKPGSNPLNSEMQFWNHLLQSYPQLLTTNNVHK